MSPGWVGEESVVSKRKGNLQRKEGRGVGERPPPCSPGGCRSPRVCLQGGAGMRGGLGPRPSDREMCLTTASCACTHAGTHTSAHAHVHTRAHTHTHTQTQISLQVPGFSPHCVATFQVGSHRGPWAVGNQHCPASPPDSHLRGS